LSAQQAHELWSGLNPLFDVTKLSSSLKFLDPSAPQLETTNAQGLEPTFAIPALGADYHRVWELMDDETSTVCGK
jgi:hypothetical protein